MQKLDEMNKTTELKVQNHQNASETISTTVLHELLFQMLHKNAKTKKNLELSYIVLWKPDLNEQKNSERLVLYRNDAT